MDTAPDPTVTTDSGRTWTWSMLTQDQRQQALTPIPSWATRAWIRDVDSRAGAALLHPDGLSGIDRDCPPA